MFCGESYFACNKTTAGVLYHPVRAGSAIGAASRYFFPFLTTFNYLKVSVLILDNARVLETVI